MVHRLRYFWKTDLEKKNHNFLCQFGPEHGLKWLVSYNNYFYCNKLKFIFSLRFNALQKKAKEEKTKEKAAKHDIWLLVLVLLVSKRVFLQEG